MFIPPPMLVGRDAREISIGELLRIRREEGSGMRNKLFAGLLDTVVGAYFLRRAGLRWGTTDEEVHKPLAGDEVVPRPMLESTHAVTIDAPAGQVWRWLVQVGQGRGGLYSYDWLENLADLDVHSAEEIVPELQDLKVGDLVRQAPAAPGA
jgi:hypothetical protein